MADIKAKGKDGHEISYPATGYITKQGKDGSIRLRTLYCVLF